MLRRAALAARPLNGVAPFTLGRAISTEAMRVNAPLKSVDPELFGIIELEKERQRRSLVLIASENFAPRYVLDALGSPMTNKYSEGYPGARYYGGNELIDRAEKLCQQRALQVYGLDPGQWGVNVQPLSGSPANLEVYTALLQPHDRIMSLDLPHGGHLSHGYQTETKKVSAISRYFEVLPYRLDEKTGLIDYEELEKFALRFRPKLIVAGTSAYSRDLDYPRFREIADKVGAVLMADMAHISGLVAGGAVASPFPHCDVVTTTTHKSLRGPRGAMIFYRRGERQGATDKKGHALPPYDYEEKINSAVFPGLQGGPHNHTICALAAALKEAASPEFKEYAKQVKSNARALGEELLARGFDLVSGGTDNHLLLVDLRAKGVSGAKVERLCEAASISINKNTIPQDKSAMNPSGVRIGSPAMTSRGLVESDFKEVGRLISAAVDLAADVQKQTGPKLVDFTEYLKHKRPPQLQLLKNEVEAFASKFPTVGF